MKITGLELIPYRLTARNIPWNLLKVYTDEGIVGYGEPVLEGRARTVATAVKELGDYIIGKDPRDVERLWQDMYKGSFYRGGCILASAVSGVEQALWDISGKWYNVPAYKLMGGKVRDKIRMYAHVRGDTIEELVQSAKERMAQGFNAIKTGGTQEPLRIIDTPAQLLKLADRIGALREIVGPEIDIGIDLHGRFSPAMAKLYMKEVEQYRPMFYEEPVLPGNDDVMADLARSTHIPIATGERLYTRWEFRRIIETRAAAIIQPDVCHCGGILELKKIAAMSEVNFCGVAPHNPMGAIALAASFQTDASTINFCIQEHITLGEGTLKTPFKLDADGFVPVPEGPGLGIEVDEEGIEKLRIADDQDGMSVHLGLWRDRDDGAFGTW
jgi:galactonate dehydratase